MRWLGPTLVAAFALLLEVGVRSATPAPELFRWVGRLHPVLVHLPLGVFVAVGFAEGATLWRRGQEAGESVQRMLVPLAAVGALGAFGLGQLLALEGGYPSETLGWHRRLSLAAVVGLAGCWALFDSRVTRRGRLAYRGALLTTLGVLVAGAHFGGTLTHGQGYLTKRALGSRAVAASTAPAEPLVFDQVVLPVLMNYCFECHGTEKQKGKLRVDSLPLLLAGGESGPVIVPGDSGKSPLVKRLLLPPEHDDHMPPEGKAGPKPEELALLRFWIDRGASPSLRVRDVLPPAVSRPLLERALGDARRPPRHDAASRSK